MANVQWSIDMAWSIANVSRGQGTKRDALNIGVGYAMMGLSVIPEGGFADDAARAAAPAAERGISVLGRHPAYVQLGEAIPSRFFNVPTWVWDLMSPAQQWAANTRFLDRLIARGDEVFLATKASAAPPGSFFARELEYLTSRGYRISEDGWRLLPPVQ